MKPLNLLGFIVITSLLFSSCGQGQKEGTSRIKIDGSSTVYPITEAIAEEFQKENRGLRVTVGVSGTGGGFKKFCQEETDINDASRPIQPTEVEECQKSKVKYIELPVALDGIAVLVHPDNDWCDSLTVEELKKIWRPGAQDKIDNWSQIRPEWPDKPLNLYGPGIDSGTFDYFTQVITGEAGASRGDYTASEDDNVLVQGISSDKNALGFFGLAYYEENKDKLKVVPVHDNNPDNGKGAIKPSLETVKNGTYQPLSRPLFIYVRKKAAERMEVEKFINFYIDEGGALAREVGYVPLSDNVQKLVQDRFKQRTTGSMFKEGEQEVDVSLQELLTQGS
jgi:phosphate transport system substrate-binding protein